MGDEMKPCPLCLTVDHLVAGSCDVAQYQSSFIKCKKCKIVLAVCDLTAIERWNNRADSNIPRAWWDELKLSINRRIRKYSGLDEVEYDALVDSCLMLSELMEKIESRGKRGE